MDTLEIVQLETRLLGLGKWELALEKSLLDLRNIARKAVESGDFEAADATWNQYEQARRELAELRRRITEVEIKLYALRRRQQRR